MSATLVTTGLACIIAAITGGGLKAFAIEIQILQRGDAWKYRLPPWRWQDIRPLGSKFERSGNKNKPGMQSRRENPGRHYTVLDFDIKDHDYQRQEDEALHAPIPPSGEAGGAHARRLHHFGAQI